ncbi:MAG: (d)CMP kinase, partial [Bdellovibrionota bacterium]
MTSGTNLTFIVTIDGPAASGKSSVSRELARRFGWSWVSTGAFYRGLAYVADAKATDLTKESELVNVALSPIWSVRMTPDQTCVYLDGQNVSDEVSRERV